MDGMVEENGTSGASGVADPLASAASSASTTPHVVVTSIVQLTLPTQAPSAQVFILIIINYVTVKTDNIFYLLFVIIRIAVFV